MATTDKASRAVWPLAAVVFLISTGLRAGEPEIRNLDVRGLQVGGTTTLVIDGDDLGASPRLLLPFAAKQTRKPGGTPKRATFDVALDAAAPPGYHHLRVAAEGGVSLPVVIGVDRLPQRVLSASPAGLPVALHGTISGSTVVSCKFTGKAGQKVTVEVEARRLGSKLRPVVHLYNPARRQLAWAWGKAALSGDARLQAVLGEDGEYTVTVHDAEYAAAAPGFFRLKLGQWSFVDRVFPPVVGNDQKTVELLGPSSPLRIDLPAVRGSEAVMLPWPREGAWSGPRPFVRVSPHAEVLAGGDGKVQTLPAAPVGVSGRLLTPYAEDRFRLAVKPGTRVRLEAFADRLGSPLAVALVVRNEAGAVLARAEEGQTTLDPVLEYTVPAKTESIVVGVADALGQGGPHGVYRLSLANAAVAAKPDFRLITPAQRISLPVGGRCVVPVLIERRGYAGAVALRAEGLPAGVKLEGATIPADGDGALVTVQRGASAAEAVVTHWRGRADDGQERSVVLQGHPLERLQPWLATELALAGSTAKAAELAIDWSALPADAGLILARKLTLPVKLIRPASPATVRLSLLTSQSPPLLNGQPNLALALRVERPVELAAKATEGPVVVLVPQQLPALGYDLAIQAELLGPDRRTVLATAFTPVRRLEVRVPLAIALAGPARIEAKLNAKAAVAVEIKGKVERREGLTGDVVVALTGLPPGASVAPVTVKAGAVEFSLKLALPPNVAPGEVKGLKLACSAAADPMQPGVRVSSRDVQLTLVIQPAGK